MSENKNNKSYTLFVHVATAHSVYNWFDGMSKIAIGINKKQLASQDLDLTLEADMESVFTDEYEAVDDYIGDPENREEMIDYYFHGNGNWNRKPLSRTYTSREFWEMDIPE